MTSERTRHKRNIPSHHKEIQLGSSLADVSDATDYTSCGYEGAPIAIQNHVPSRFVTRGPGPNARSQLQTAIRRISSSLDGITQGWRLTSQDYEMHNIRGSFDSLASSNSSDDFHNGTHWDSSPTVNFHQGEDRKDYQRRISDADNMTSPNIPRLPFPLISLPEAAKLQHVRRERGEEDHTEPGSSFVARGFSETISTISASTSPRTPRSVLLPSNYQGKGDQPNKPSPTYTRWNILQDDSSKKRIFL